MDQKYCFFRLKLRICGCILIITNLQTCDLRTSTTQKFADLRLLYRISPRIDGFAIGGLKKIIAWQSRRGAECSLPGYVRYRQIFHRGKSRDQPHNIPTQKWLCFLSTIAAAMTGKTTDPCFFVFSVRVAGLKHALELIKESVGGSVWRTRLDIPLCNPFSMMRGKSSFQISAGHVKFVQHWGQILGRNPDKTHKSFPPYYSQSLVQLCLEISISANSRNLLQFLQYTVKEKGGKPDRKPYPLSFGIRNPHINIKSENSQDYTQKPQRNAWIRLLVWTAVLNHIRKAWKGLPAHVINTYIFYHH